MELVDILARSYTLPVASLLCFGLLMLAIGMAIGAWPGRGRS